MAVIDVMSLVKMVLTLDTCRLLTVSDQWHLPSGISLRFTLYVKKWDGYRRNDIGLASLLVLRPQEVVDSLDRIEGT